MQIMYKDQDLLMIHGQINLNTALSLRLRGQQLIKDIERPCKISLADVYAVQPIAVSLILCWVRYAKKYNKQIYFIDIPKPLILWLNLIKLDYITKQ